MTKKLLIVGATTLGLATFISYSFSAGPSTQPTAGNRTGSAGTQANCDGSFCHGGIATSTFLSIRLMDGATPVTNYKPNQTYQVIIAGGTTNGNRPGFGFQCAAVKESSTGTQAGTFNVGTATNIAVRTSGTLSLVEHTSILTGTGTGNTWGYQSTFNWVAPAAGTGNVKFFLTLLSANNNSAVSGDSANNTTAVFTEAPVGVGQTPDGIHLQAFPNPANQLITLDAGTVPAGHYTLLVHSATGQKVVAQSLTHSGGALKTSVPCEHWASGTYFLQLQSSEGAWSTSMVKR